ncbi:MAG: M61 family metallopeptidase [Thiomicrospira sp.]|uniref:M61 family metallopeptidase n=1 Tax=Thiomicrospira sp. TaxID=935 RepID=UPI0019E06D4A|nr:PDZ domain-containing protein [Thiomicrospira sp.]MBE0493746.1 M61 family metallopeptidase [Thiomicrospira sp.]
MQQQAIHYTISLADPHAHLFDVCMEITHPDLAGQVVSLPSWIPGSYMIRDFAKHLIGLHAETLDGQPLFITSLDKSHWEIQSCDEPLRVKYQVYAWDLSVRGAHFDQTHAFFNGTSTFLMAEGQRGKTVSLDIEANDFTRHQAWCVATAMQDVKIDAQGFGRYLAADYDELIDHPVEIGAHTQAEFVAEGIKHQVVLTGQHDCDLARLIQDLQKICQTQLRFFGKPAPFPHYVFMVMVVGDGYGGLEHRHSTALVCSRESLPYVGMQKASDEYLQFLELCSHEYFHSWNVKRIMPAQFQTPNLSQPAYTEQLWWFEGATSVYDLLFLYKAGLVDDTLYLRQLARQMSTVYRMPGRFKQSVSESSFHTWTKFYQQDENAPNAIISYYTKGSLIAFGLDFTIRQATQNQKCLDHLLMRLWHEYGQPQIGLKEGEIERLASEVAGVDLTDFFDRYLRGTEDLPFEQWFGEVGIDFKLRAATSASDLGGETDSTTPYLSLGANLSNTEHQSVKLSHVWQQRPAHLAGLAANDEIMALNGLKTPNVATLEKILARQQVGRQLDCHFFRRDELIQTQIELDATPKDRVVLGRQDSDATPVWPKL